MSHAAPLSDERLAEIESYWLKRCSLQCLRNADSIIGGKHVAELVAEVRRLRAERKAMLIDIGKLVGVEVVLNQQIDSLRARLGGA